MITGMAERGGSPVESTGASPLDVLDEAGFIATLASNSEFEIERYLHLGETVVGARRCIESISEEKQTRIGRGHFVTWVTTYTVGDGEVVGRQRFRILKFKPGGGRMSIRLAPSMSPDTQFFWDGLKEHRLLIQRCTVVRHAAPPAPADVPVVQLARLGHDRGVGPGHGPQLRHAAAPAVPVLRGPLHRGARRARGGHPPRLEPVRRRAGGGVHRHAGRGRSTPSSTTAWCCTSSARRVRAMTRASGDELPVAGDRDDRHPHRRRRHRHPRLHAGPPRPRLRQQPGRAGHLHEHHLDQRATAAGT